MAEERAGKVEQQVAQQRELYGEPVGDLVRRVTGGLGITQAAAADVLGLSPAMLSQLMSGQRVKIGNPLAVARLQALLALAEEGADLSRGEVADRLEEIKRSRATMTTTQTAARGVVRPADHARESAELVGRVLRAVASGRELAAAAAALDEVAPGLAEVVRLYGTGAVGDAAEHLRSLGDLLEAP